MFLDGVDVRELGLHALRERLAVAPQDTFLFSTTVADEHRLRRRRTRTGPRSSARPGVAHLDEDVRGFPAGYDTLVGERGITLSGGQRQRVAIARAVLRDAPVLMLDDCLSSVDTHTEEAVLRGLRDVSAGRTTLIVSHRVSTVRDADEIVVLEDGAVAERGTHESLLALGGRYAGAAPPPAARRGARGLVTPFHEEEAAGRAYDHRLMRRLLGYLRPYRGQVWLAGAVVLLDALAQLAGPMLTKEAIDRGIRRHDLVRLDQVAVLYLLGAAGRASASATCRTRSCSAWASTS